MKALHYSSIQQAIDYIVPRTNSGFLIFSNVTNVQELSKVVGEHVVLCSTSGEYTPEGYRQNVITGFEFNLQEADFIEILNPPIKSVAQLKQSYKKVQHNPNAFMLLLCDGLSAMEESIITTFHFIDDRFKIVGGSAGDGAQFKETQIYIGSKKVHSVALFFNSQQKTQIIKENIYVPTGKKLLVTDADPIKRIVKTFNNKPASTEYAKVLGVSEAELPKYFMENPLARVYKDDIFIASPMKVNPDKSITFYCQIMPNGFVEVLEPSDPVGVIRQTLRSCSFKPSFVLAINCVLRSIKFENDRIWSKMDQELLAFCKNTTGFVSYGEQYYKNHLNQTMVMLVVG